MSGASAAVSNRPVAEIGTTTEVPTASGMAPVRSVPPAPDWNVAVTAPAPTRVNPRTRIFLSVTAATSVLFPLLAAAIFANWASLRMGMLSTLRLADRVLEQRVEFALHPLHRGLNEGPGQNA